MTEAEWNQLRSENPLLLLEDWRWAKHFGWMDRLQELSARQAIAEGFEALMNDTRTWFQESDVPF